MINDSDQNSCPQSWSPAGDQCVQLQFGPLGRGEAEMECRQMGAQLVDVVDGEGELDTALVGEVAELLEVSDRRDDQQGE